jgi:hypothetical protein
LTQLCGYACVSSTDHDLSIKQSTPKVAPEHEDLKDVVRELRERGVHLKAIDPPVDTGSAVGKAFLDICVHRVQDKPQA